jgi:uncharacterized membrane protein
MPIARRAQYMLCLGAVAWVAVLFLAPALLFPVGQFICHQRPERSFFVHGQQLAVCARCTGLYLGAAIGAPLALMTAASLVSSRARMVLLVAALPTAVTWSLEFARIAPFSNTTRFILAVPLGLAAAWLVLGVFAGGEPHLQPRTSNGMIR